MWVSVVCDLTTRRSSAASSAKRVSASCCRGHKLAARKGKLRLRAAADEQLTICPKSPRPSYADQVPSFYRDAGIEPIVGTEAKELQTALGLVVSGGGVCIVPASVKRLD